MGTSLAKTAGLLQNERLTPMRPLPLKLLMGFAVVAVFALALFDLLREEARALDDFTAEQATLAGAFSAALSARFDGMDQLLKDALVVEPSALPAFAEHALLEPAVGKLRVTDGSGAVLVEAQRPDALDGWPPAPSTTAISPPLSDGRSRLLMRRGHGRVALAVVDTPRLFAGLTDDTALRWLVRDEGGRFSTLGNAPWQTAAGAGADWQPLLAAMGGGGRGALLVSRALADALGLGPRRAVAGFAPVAIAGAARWSVAVVASARRVRDRGRLAAWRLGAATGLASLLVALFALVVASQQRRALDLRRALEVAEERAQSQQKMIRAEKLGTVGTLAAGVAHEIGTPLGIISGRAELLLSQTPAGTSSDGTRKSLSSILAQVDKVSTIIRQLLDFARVRPIEADAVTPAAALAHAASLLDHRFVQAKVTLTVDAPADLPAVAADPGQLEQVLVNLLLNACDACAHGAPRSGHAVIACAERVGERMAFEIRDDGEGIPPENLASVLDPFFTTKKRGQGTGLGLTIAADIVRNHGGQLEIESTVGVGTTVRVLLPLAQAQKDVSP